MTTEEALEEMVKTVEELAEEVVRLNSDIRSLKIACENVRTITNTIKIRKEYRDEILKQLPKEDEQNV